MKNDSVKFKVKAKQGLFGNPKSSYVQFVCLFIRARVLNISLAVRSKPERISDRLEDPVSHAPLAFNSQGELLFLL
nr:hypothetical protein [Tanacetum cinerariifolium]